MGTILHANEDLDAADTYLLIRDNVVADAVIGSYNFVYANLLNNYDYLIDVTVSEQDAGIGWSYDPETDTFTEPPEDFEAELEAALVAVDTAIEAAADAYSACSSEDQSTAIGNVMSELSTEPQAEIDIMTAVVTYLQG